MTTRPASEASGALVLLVDDAEDCLATLDVALADMDGVALRPFRSAEDALECLGRQAVAAVVTDIQLPNMNGLDLVRQIRRMPSGRNVAIIVLSAGPDPGTPGNAMKAGADAFFAKPFSPLAVRRKLEELIHV